MLTPDKTNIVLCIAPHPDDETLGCGGTLLRHVARGDIVHWLIMTAMSPSQGFSPERIACREREVAAVANAYGFAGFHSAGFATTQLDVLPKSELVEAISRVIREEQPTIIYIPFRNDVHTDHAIVFDAAVSCTKRFRYPSVRRVRVYETLSETEFGLRTDDPGFRPNCFIDISAWLERKIEIMRMFEGEVGEAPFPRSAEAIRALATYRGIVAGTLAAEAFMILRDIE